jgi:hypothetical protein
MRPVDFIGRVVRAESKQLVSQVEGTIFQYEDKIKGVAAWQGSFLKWKNEEALLAAHQAGEALLLVCNDGRQGAIVLDPEVADWGTAMRFRGAGPLGAATVAPAWSNLDRIRAEDGNPDTA